MWIILVDYKPKVHIENCEKSTIQKKKTKAIAESFFASIASHSCCLFFYDSVKEETADLSRNL